VAPGASEVCAWCMFDDVYRSMKQSLDAVCVVRVIDGFAFSQEEHGAVLQVIFAYFSHFIEMILGVFFFNHPISPRNPIYFKSFFFKSAQNAPRSKSNADLLRGIRETSDFTVRFL